MGNVPFFHGRLYRAGESQQVQWSVEVHPAKPEEDRQKSHGFVKKDLYTFHACRLANVLHDLGEGQPLVILGTGSGFTLWSIVTAETTATGELKVTEGLLFDHSLLRP